MMRCDGRARDALLYILGTLTGGTVPGTQTAQMHRIYCTTIGNVLRTDDMLCQRAQ
jgi:hypothetical protein